MVLRWYGCDIDPEKARSAACQTYAPGDPACNFPESDDTFEVFAKSCGLCKRSVPGKQAVDDFLSSTHEPLVVNVDQTMNGGYHGGHFVAVAGYDNSNYYVYDPGSSGGVFTVPAATFEGYMAGSPGTNTAFYKSDNGSCQ